MTGAQLLLETIAKHDEERRNIISDVQDNCAHGDVLEANYRPSGNGFFGEPPFRVCRDCGYAEEGWDCEYLKLGSLKLQSVPIKVDRATAYQYVVKFMTRQMLTDSRAGKPWTTTTIPWSGLKEENE